MQHNTEVEVRFLNIDPQQLKAKLSSLKAIDKGEKFLEEVIFYDKDLTWSKQGQFVRLRGDGDQTTMCYKRHSYTDNHANKTLEIELIIKDFAKGEEFLKNIGLIPFRKQQKKRHSFILNNVIVDIDIWPKLPPYVEIEGESMEDIKAAAIELGFDWQDVIHEDAKVVIEKYYHIPVSKLRYFTFERVE